MPLQRFADWRDRLGAFMRANSPRPFRWGRWDCCIFVCDAVRAMTGEDLAAQFRGKYATALGARRLVGYSMEKFLESMALHRGILECQPPLSFSAGDVVLLEIPGGPCVGVAGLNGLPACVTTAGLVVLSRKSVLRAWKVG